MKLETFSSLRRSMPTPVVDNYVLTSSYFVKSEPVTKKRFFRSEIRDLGNTQDLNDSQAINYQQLISNEHGPKAIKKFMQMILQTPNIIIEEKDLKEVHEEVRQNPKKCFSVRDQDGSVNCSADEIEFPSNKTLCDTGAFTPKDIVSSTQSSFRRDTRTNSDSQPALGLLDSLTDFSSLTESQIQLLVNQKMKKLEKYNRKLLLKDKQMQPNFGLTISQIEAFSRFQRLIRSMILRKKFLRALRMDAEFEHKINYIKLKKSLKLYDNNRNTDFLARYSLVVKSTQFAQ